MGNSPHALRFVMCCLLCMTVRILSEGQTLRMERPLFQESYHPLPRLKAPIFGLKIV